MTPQQEQQLRLQAKARGYDPAKEEAFVQFAMSKETPQTIPKTAPKQKGQGFIDRLKQSASQGISKIKEAGKDINSGNPIRFMEGALKAGAGAVDTAFSPITAAAEPVIKPTVGKAMEFVVDKISDNPTVQKFANSKAGQATSRIAEDVNNLNTIASVVSIPKVGAKIPTGLKQLQKVGKVGSKIDEKLAGTPSKAIDKLESRYEEIFTGTKPASKQFAKSTARQKTPARFLAEHGLVVDVKSGKIDPTKVISQIEKNTEPLNEILQDILITKDKQLPTSNYISLQSLAQKAKQKLATDMNRASGDFSKMSKQVDDVIAELQMQYGDNVNLSTTNIIKQAQWKNSKFDMTRPSFASDVHRKIGNAAKEAIEDAIEEADIKNLNQYIGDHYDAITNLEKINGNTVKGGRLGLYAGRTLGAIAGAKGGFLGSLAGAYAGDVVASILQNNYIASPIKRMMLQKLMTKSGVGSEAYKSAQKALLKLQTSTKLLPSGNSALKGNRNVQITKDVINLPSKLPSEGSRIRTETNLNRLLPSGRNIPDADYTSQINLPSRIKRPAIFSKDNGKPFKGKGSLSR